MPRTRSLLLLPTLVLLAACATPKEIFLHGWHRENYAIGAEELKQLQFYISTQVLAQEDSASQSPAAAESVILVPDGTPGLVTGAGPNWLRVSFQEGGSGVPFLADPKGGDDSYWLATEVPGQPGFRKVKELSEKVLRQQGRAYRVVYGSSAQLLVSSRDLEQLIAQRRHLEGRAKEAD